jgi:hypothetical protein
MPKMSYMTSQALTTKEKALLRAVQKGEGKGGIYGLASALERNQRRVLDNVNRLEELGYVRTTSKLKNGREIKSVTPAVTGSVMTVVNVSLPQTVTKHDLISGLNMSGQLTSNEQSAVTSFFAEVPSSLAMRFLNENGITLAKAADAYKRHVKSFQSLPQTEVWLNVDSPVEAASS